jgi:hypothetical protein
MANKSLLVSILFLLLAIPIVSASGIIVTFDILPSGTMTTTIIQPTNISYIMDKNIKNNFTFSAISSNDSTFRIRGYIDGVQEFNDPNYANNSIATFEKKVSSGTHNFTIYATDSIGNSRSTVIFTRGESEKVWFSALIPLIMSAGGLLFLVKMFIGSPKNGRELVEMTLASVIIFSLLVSGIIIIMGLI